MTSCRECANELAAGAKLDICPRCRRLERYRERPRGKCGDCGVVVGPNNKSGFCSRCNTARLNTDPEFQEKRLAGLAEKFADPEFAEAARKRGQRMGQKYSIDPEVQARRIAWGKHAYANWLGTPEVRERANTSPLRGKKVSESRMGWCPEEMRQRYRFLVRTKKLKAAEARKIVLREWNDRQALKHVDSALDYLRRLAPVQRLENGYRVGFSDVLSPSEVIHRAELQGWEPERWAA